MKTLCLNTSIALAARLSALSDHGLSPAEAAEAAGNLVGFVTLLTRADAESQREAVMKKAGEMDRSIVKPKARADRVHLNQAK